MKRIDPSLRESPDNISRQDHRQGLRQMVNETFLSERHMEPQKREFVFIFSARCLASQCAAFLQSLIPRVKAFFSNKQVPKMILYTALAFRRPDFPG